MSGRADLGLPPDADRDTIRRRFRALAKLAHPDVGGTADDFVRLRDAYRRALREPARTNGDRGYSEIVDEYDAARRDAEELFRRTYGVPPSRPSRSMTAEEARVHDILKDRVPWAAGRDVDADTCLRCGGSGRVTFYDTIPSRYGWCPSCTGKGTTR